MRHLDQAVCCLEDSCSGDTAYELESWGLEGVNVTSELPLSFPQKNLPTGKIWLHAEDSLPESKMKAVTTSVHLGTLRRNESGKGYFIFRVSKYIFQQVRLQGEQ